ncbi:DUF4129 domain-containing protein [Xylanibacillus composti]|uniref:Transglutaminase-like domain-containing protein n=1 Tax=Xylanibacillus composti TaxID=1572762 RepID=A0A8J4M351_9BACL|nr:transglutaminase domain-containing protein [Xylanibacillus composti]MDT9724478.1 DUF4129 domain-containing protein [Xylanibacillus composti]GIQ69740.1 hypothetical protein XYCOK13_25640 [Xylanibacillus composti]
MIKARLKALLSKIGQSWMAAWSDRLASAAWAAIVLQFAFWLGHESYNGYTWYAETRTVVFTSLILCGLAEALLPMRKTIRVLVQLGVILWVHGHVLQYEPFWEEGRSFGGNLLQNVQPFLPYLWYALAFWCAYQFVLAWAKSKIRVIGLVLAAILVMAVADSTGKIYLWQETAIIVCSGLVLAILSHYNDFRKRHPQAWKYLEDYPGTIIWPAVIVIAATVGAGTAAPEARPLLTDPYTAWQNWKGNDVSRIGQKPLSSSSATQSTANASSGYGRDDRELGGGFDYDHSEVMSVVTDRRSYWRGESKSTYTGEGWEAVLTEAVPIRLQTPIATPAMGDYVEVRQTVTVLSEHAYPVLFGAMQPAVIEQVNGDSEGPTPDLAWSAENAALLYRGDDDEYPKTYTLVSHVPVIDAEALRNAEPRTSSMNQYTALPDTVPERVKALAEEIAAEANNDYDRAKAVETYLRETFPYTNQPDIGKGSSPDFVDRFLFEIQEGYCDYYSTAMAVMLRTLDIPTRWVKGYTSGSNRLEIYGFEDAINRFSDPNGAGDYMVRNSDAHSWVEVYFEGHGWIPFEPTASFFMPIAESVEETSPAFELPEVETGGVEESEAPAGDNRSAIGIAAGAVILAGLLLYVLFKKGMLTSAGSYLLRPIRKKPRGHDEQVILTFEALLKFARKRGYTRHDSETARESIERWIANNRGLEPELTAVLQLFEEAKYSGVAVKEQDAERIAELLEHLKKAM